MQTEEQKAQSERDKLMLAKDIRIRPVRNGFIMKTLQGEFVYTDIAKLMEALRTRLSESPKES